MPAGCEFICKNKQCENFNAGFVVTAPWPMGDIRRVLNSKKLEKEKELRKIIRDMKRNGKKYACITYPDSDNLEVLAFRVQLWSPDALCVWEFDIEAKDENELLEKLEDSESLPEKCPKTGCKLLDFKQICELGILCPSCSERLTQSRWYTNEEIAI